MRLVFDGDTLHQSKMGSVTGVFYVQFGSIGFPDERWSDFVVVMGWWIEAIEKFDRGVADESTLRFMDGPYWISLTRHRDGAVLLRCVEDRKGAGVVHEEFIDYPAFRAQVRWTVNQVVSACRRIGIESSEVGILRRYLSN